jgi:NADH/NAD ratio-sensing transcriptional regulator Rex
MEAKNKGVKHGEQAMRVLDHIINFERQNGRTPTTKEITAWLGIHPTKVRGHLRTLRAYGRIEYGYGVPLKVLPVSDKAPTIRELMSDNHAAAAEAQMEMGRIGRCLCNRRLISKGASRCKMCEADSARQQRMA